MSCLSLGVLGGLFYRVREREVFVWEVWSRVYRRLLAAALRSGATFLQAYDVVGDSSKARAADDADARSISSLTTVPFLIHAIR